MTLSFYTVSPSTLESPKCWICSKPFSSQSDKDQEAVVHEGESGNSHPFHRRCIKEWLLSDPHCPACRTAVNVNSLLTCGDMILLGLRAFAKGVLDICSEKRAMQKVMRNGSEMGQVPCAIVVMPDGRAFALAIPTDRALGSLAERDNGRKNSD